MTLTFSLRRALKAPILMAVLLIPAGCRTQDRDDRPVDPQARTASPDTLGEGAGTSAPPVPTPAMKSVLDQLAALGGKPIETLTPAEARRQPTPADAVKALLDEQGKSTAPEPVGNVEDRTIPGAAGPIPVRIYTPKGEGPFPVVVYYHGGGWVIATINTYDASARALTNAANAVVVSVEYRKAPENKFPAAHEDALAAYRWALENTAEINGDPSRVAVAGESAGGNLAAAVAMLAADQGLQPPVHQLLVYPIANYAFDSESYRQNAQAKPLNAATMRWFFDHYLSSPAEGRDPRISLVSADDLSGLPPATVITAEIDPLRSEGQRYAELLDEAGVAVDARNYEGVTHEFFGMGAVLPQAKEAVNQAGGNLREVFEAAGDSATGANRTDSDM